MESIIQFAKSEKEVTRYYKYAVVIAKINEYLTKETGEQFHQFSDIETTNEIWEVLEEDIALKSEELQYLKPIYDFTETADISSVHNEKKMEFIIKQRMQNQLYYYPKFKVALARTSMFMENEENVKDLIFGANEKQMKEFLDYILVRKRQYIKDYVTIFVDSDGGVETGKEKITNLVHRDDVFLEEEMKKQIYRSIDEFFNNNGEFFRTYNIPYKRGILLYGEPGNGKTTLVKSIANSISAPVAYWQITEYTSSYSIGEVFSSVAKMAPMVLVIEDIDSMPEEVRSFFLNTLDGATSKEGIFLIGTTNYPEEIDPALINRSGRFDRAYEIPMPNPQFRRDYLVRKKMTEFISMEELEEIVILTDGCSYADLNEIYNSTALQWHYDKKVDVTVICKEIQNDNHKMSSRDWKSNKKQFGFRS